MPKFDTCFFERYAKMTLARLLGDEFADLVNEDRPDLQSPDRKRLGIEVTRAMEESRNAASMLLKELAGIVPCEADIADMNQIIASGYGYGLQSGKYIGTREYDYWALAMPLKRILESKVNKVMNGFYGHFDRMGLYVFCKDNLTDERVETACRFVSGLQGEGGSGYDTLYLSEISSLHVCSLSGRESVASYDIPPGLRKSFFLEALKQ